MVYSDPDCSFMSYSIERNKLNTLGGIPTPVPYHCAFGFEIP